MEGLMCVLELLDHGWIGGLEAELLTVERRLRIRRQERITSNMRVGLDGGEHQMSIILKELNHVHVRLTALRVFGTVKKIMTLVKFMENMTKK